MFPNIGCILNTNFNETAPISINYLGNKFIDQKAYGTFDLLTDTNQEFKDIWNWYTNTVNYGHDSFQINLPLFGVIRNWNVRIIKEPQAKLQQQEQRITTFNIVILDNIKDYV